MSKVETNIDLKLNYGKKNKVDISQISEDELIFLTDKGLPIPETTDNGKFVKVNANGEFEFDNVSVPTKTSDLTNDSGFVTSADVPSTYLKSASVSDDTLTITKQDDTTITFAGGGSTTLFVDWS